MDGGTATSSARQAWPPTPTARLDFTGQRRDDTGLLFYNARYYDPAIGRFASADMIVPSAPALTVAPLDGVARGVWGQQGAPHNPQDLNRYSSVNNNPVNATDPTGHFLDTILDVAFIAYGIYDIAANGYTAERGLALAADVGGALIPGLTGAGAMVRAATHADDVVDAVKVASGTVDAVKAACSFPADTPVLTAIATTTSLLSKLLGVWKLKRTFGQMCRNASQRHLLDY
ncbi:MAG: hypothetical protein H7Z42_13345 [Roseiflexaceae bacterium]|nr:hypothetical protein [Roseiflexaceae bacterium]